MLKAHLPRILESDFSKPLEETGLPPEIVRSVIAHQGKLAENFEFLMPHLEEYLL